MAVIEIKFSIRGGLLQMFGENLLIEANFTRHLIPFVVSYKRSRLGVWVRAVFSGTFVSAVRAL